MDRLLASTYRAEDCHFWFRGLRRFARPLIADALAGIPAPRILDAGCGTGRNLMMLDAFGQAYGVDLTPLGLSFAAGRGRRTIARATVTHLPFPDAAFDLVTSFDVLYALGDEDEPLALAEMWRVLRPGGAVLINVAAMNVVRGGHSAALAFEQRRYTLASLRQALQRAGFQPVRLSYAYASLFPVLVAVRATQRLLGWPAAGAELEVPPAPVNAALKGLLSLEARALRHVDMPFGSSVLCLARK